VTPNVIYCDIDETVSQFVRPFITFARTHGATVADYENWSERRGGLAGDEFNRLLRLYEVGGYQRQPIDRAALDGLWELFRSGRHIAYITFRSRAFWGVTRDWIVDRGLPMGEVITLGPGADKAAVIDARGDGIVWIDDMPPAHLTESCEVAMVPRPWNAYCQLRRLTWAAIVGEFRA